jgi:hypothetical protein
MYYNKNINFKMKINERFYINGDWGLGIGDWGLGPIPNPQSPIPNPQSPRSLINDYTILNIKYNLLLEHIIYLT